MRMSTGPFSSLQFDRDHFNEVFVDLKWFESKVGNKYLNEAAGLAAEEEAAMSKDKKKKDKVRGTHTQTRLYKVNTQTSVQNHKMLRVLKTCVFTHVCVCVCKQESAMCLAALDEVAGRGGAPGRSAAEEEGEEEDMFEAEFRQYKRTYYMTKMGVDVVSE